MATDPSPKSPCLSFIIKIIVRFIYFEVVCKIIKAVIPPICRHGKIGLFWSVQETKGDLLFIFFVKVWLNLI